MDLADESMLEQEAQLEHFVEVARKPKPRLYSIGVCHACHEPVDSPKLFCDNTCAAAFDKIEHARKQKLP